MDTLENLINQKLKEFFPEEKELKDFITDDKKSADFIRRILKDKSFANEEGYSVESKIAQSRARHSAITFLLGLVFQPFYSFESNLYKDSITKQEANRLWMMVSLYHDIGYFSERIENAELDYKDAFTYDLFTDAFPDKLGALRNFSKEYSSAMAYTYDEILAYDRYARVYHKEERRKDKNHSESIDHGILGGVIAFNRTNQKSTREQKDRERILSKYCALTIAQHNIYKSDDKETDEKFSSDFPLLCKKLRSDSEFRINKETPLLLFLCLIDTVEAVKKFSKSANNGMYFETLTVLRKIKADVRESELQLDFTDLLKEIKAKEEKKGIKFKDTYQKHLKAIRTLGTWTCFQTESKDEIITIKHNAKDSKKSEITISQPLSEAS